MNHEHDDINLTVNRVDFSPYFLMNTFVFFQVVQRASSLDSLEPIDGENLRFISGCHKWINTNSSVRVDNDHRPVEIISVSDDEHSIVLKTLSTTTNTEKVFVRNPLTNEEEEDYSQTQMDVSANQFDFDYRSIHYEMFSSDFEKKLSPIDLNRTSKSNEMEMDNGENHSDETNQQSQNKKKKKKNDSESDEKGNGENPNRNNNNSRR